MLQSGVRKSGCRFFDDALGRPPRQTGKQATIGWAAQFDMNFRQVDAFRRGETKSVAAATKTGVLEIGAVAIGQHAADDTAVGEHMRRRAVASG